MQNFARLPARARAVDLGTGTGILPILLCARDPAVRFEAVELQPACADMASRSVALNHLEDRIRVHTMDLKDAPDRLGHSAFDAVLCNPPYGKRGGALRNPGTNWPSPGTRSPRILPPSCAARPRCSRTGAAFS